MKETRFNKVKSIFEQALEIESTQREKFLNDKCRTDSKLKKEVQSLLDAYGKSNDFLEPPVKEKKQTHL